MAAAIMIGFTVRAMFVLPASFPLNDGGMFYAMVRDVQASAYRLPAFTSYNGAHIPFAYPPLGFYLAAVVNDLTPLGLIGVLHFLPLVLSTLTIVAFFLLARDMLTSRVAIAAAVLFFALLPPSFTWMIMGGGLTRALGFLFAILAIREVRLMYLRAAPRRVALVAILAALTVLSHLEMAWLVCLTAMLFFVAYGRNRRGLLMSVLVGLATLALTAPWWLTVVTHHGIAPFVAAAHSTGSSWWHPIALLVQFNTTGEPLFPVLGMLTALGVVVCLKHRQYLLPAWVVAAAFLDQRAFLTSSTLAVAMLAAVGLHEVVLPLVTGARLRPSPLAQPLPDPASTPRPTRWLLPVVIAVIASYPVLSAIASTPVLLGVSPAERQAMAWIRADTPASSEFVIVSGRPWPVDRDSEWFPVLAQRKSVATVQGYEWLPNDQFDAQRAAFVDLQQCANGDGACLDRWAAASGKTFQYVYVATIPTTSPDQHGVTCCDRLRTSLRSDPRYALVYDGAGATIFKRLY
ncbi:MAG: hypothetical protein ACYC9X_01105 [Dehalococcoidia bacterium]